MTFKRIGLALVVSAAPLLAVAQEASTTTTATPAPQNNSAQINSATGPVNVTWGQPAVVPNAADYQVTVAALDKNGDGVITRAEVPATHALSSEFKLVDRNHDGRITEAELAAWR